jgi:hypothetical protein
VQVVTRPFGVRKIALFCGACTVALALLLRGTNRTAIAQQKNYMSMAGEVLAALEGPRLMNQHCAKAAPEFSAANTRAFRAWLARNAPLFDRAHAELERADRYLALPSTPKDPGLETVDKILARLQGAVSAMLSKNGPAAERRFCRRFPKYLTDNEKATTEEISALLDRIEHGPHPE